MESRGFPLPEPFIARVLMNVFSALEFGGSEGTPIAATNLSAHSAIASLEGMADYYSSHCVMAKSYPFFVALVKRMSCISSSAFKSFSNSALVPSC